MEGLEGQFDVMGTHRWRCWRLYPGRMGMEGCPVAERGDSPHPAYLICKLGLKTLKISRKQY